MLQVILGILTHNLFLAVLWEAYRVSDQQQEVAAAQAAAATAAARAADADAAASRAPSLHEAANTPLLSHSGARTTPWVRAPSTPLTAARSGTPAPLPELARRSLSGFRTFALAESPHQEERHCERRCQVVAARIAHSYSFGALIVAIVGLSTLTMLAERQGMKANYHALLEAASHIFVFVLACEVALRRVAAGGWRAYWDQGYNRLDCVLVLLGLLELAEAQLVHWRDLGAAATEASLLRVFRLLRVFKLLRLWPALQRVLRSVQFSLASLSDMTMLLLLLIFVFAAVGVQIFGGREAPRPNGAEREFSFDSLPQACSIVLICMTGEDWPIYWRRAVQTTGTVLGGAYYVALLVLGTYVMLNLVVTAVIAGVHDASKAQEAAAQEPDPSAAPPLLRGKNLKRLASPLHYMTYCLRDTLYARRHHALYLLPHGHCVRQVRFRLTASRIHLH